MQCNGTMVAAIVAVANFSVIVVFFIIITFINFDALNRIYVVINTIWRREQRNTGQIVQVRFLHLLKARGYQTSNQAPLSNEA
jgi:hypothetical protein